MTFPCIPELGPVTDREYLIHIGVLTAPTKPPQKTREEARKEFRRTGTSIRAWARQHGFGVQNTYQVLIGRNTGERGEAHRIAVTLGIKDGMI